MSQPCEHTLDSLMKSEAIHAIKCCWPLPLIDNLSLALYACIGNLFCPAYVRSTTCPRRPPSLPSNHVIHFPGFSSSWRMCSGQLVMSRPNLHCKIPLSTLCWPSEWVSRRLCYCHSFL